MTRKSKSTAKRSKAYLNRPCPCGSTSKYKDCCGMPRDFLDLDRLKTLATVDAFCVWDGRKVPVLTPIVEYDDHILFDRWITQCGVWEFIRPVHPSDMPSQNALDHFSIASMGQVTHTYVSGTPGLRTRLPLILDGKTFDTSEITHNERTPSEQD